MIDPHRLRVLRTVVATGSVSAAASRLGYTPSAISQHLSALQRETGLVLLERRGRGVEPTAAGRALADEAERLLTAVRSVEAAVDDLRAGRSGRLSMRYIGSAGAAWIPAVVTALVAEFPDLRLDLRLTELSSGDDPPPDLDVFVGHEPVDAGGCTVHHLLDDPYVVALPAGHPLAGRDAVRLAELAPLPWVDNDVSRGLCRHVLLDACAQAGFVPDFRIETPDYPTALSIVSAGIGLTVLPLLGVGACPPGVVTVPVVDPRPVRRIGVAVRAAVERHPAAVRALQLLRERVDRPAAVAS